MTSWRARRLAQATHILNQAAARAVDAEVAARITTCGVIRIDRAVDRAAATHDPAALAAREARARRGWGVELHHARPGSGYEGDDSSFLHAIGDRRDLSRFHALLNATAHHLASLPTPHEGAEVEDHGVRQARAGGDRRPRRHRHQVARPGRRPRARLDREDHPLPPPEPSRPHRPARDRRCGRGRGRRADRSGHAGPDQVLARTLPGHRATRPRPDRVRVPGRRWMPTTHPPGCGTRHPARCPLCLPRLHHEAPAAATSTTPPPTSPPSTADHPARPTPTTSPPSADDTTASRPSATGPTTATPPGYTWTAPTTDASASPATPPRPWSETGRGPARVRAGNEVLT